MDAIVEMPGKALVKSSKGDGLVPMNRALEVFAPALALSKRYSQRWNVSIYQIGVIGEPRSVDTARKIHHGFLSALVEMDRACKTLQQVTSGHPPVDRATALSMLNVLFAAIGKRKSDEESALLLAAASDMFNPVNDILGCITGVEKINRHPLVLAIAVKTLIATAKFTSCAELREAMAKVERDIRTSAWHLEVMTGAIDRADAMLFEQDRATWDELHARGDAVVQRFMLRDLEDIEGPREEDGEFPATPGSPRWQALDELLKAKTPKRIAAARKRGNVKRSKRSGKREQEQGERELVAHLGSESSGRLASRRDIV